MPALDGLSNPSDPLPEHLPHALSLDKTDDKPVTDALEALSAALDSANPPVGAGLTQVELRLIFDTLNVKIANFSKMVIDETQSAQLQINELKEELRRLPSREEWEAAWKGEKAAREEREKAMREREEKDREERKKEAEGWVKREELEKIVEKRVQERMGELEERLVALEKAKLASDPLHRLRYIFSYGADAVPHLSCCVERRLNSCLPLISLERLERLMSPSSSPAPPRSASTLAPPLSPSTLMLSISLPIPSPIRLLHQPSPLPLHLQLHPLIPFPTASASALAPFLGRLPFPPITPLRPRRAIKPWVSAACERSLVRRRRECSVGRARWMLAL
jgi:hypothetical protein